MRYLKIYGGNLIGFDKIIGHDKIKDYLIKITKNQKIANTYIFAGAKGLGKFRVAKIFANILHNNENLDREDFVVIDADGKNIGIDLVREKLIDDVNIKPMRYCKKIYIIKQAQKLTIQAQNALLKTLEEPPEYALIILVCTDENKLLSTIRSRSVILNFTSPSLEDSARCIVDKLGIDIDDAKMLSKLTDNNVGQAIRYSTIYKEKDRFNNLLHVLRHMDEMKNYEVISFVRSLNEDEKAFFLQLIYCMYRDMLTYKLSNDPNAIILKVMQTDIMKSVRKISYDSMYRSIEEISKAMIRREANANIESIFEVLLLSIKENRNEDNRG